MIEITINGQTQKINSLYDIYKYEYIKITAIKIIDYDFVELPKDMINIEKIYIKNCNRIKFTLPTEYKEVKELYIENSKYKYFDILPDYKKLYKLIIKCCYNFYIPDYQNLEYLIIDKYFLNLKEKQVFKKYFPNLKYCRIKDILNMSEITIYSNNLKFISNDTDINIPVNFYDKNNSLICYGLNNDTILILLDDLINTYMINGDNFKRDLCKLMEFNLNVGIFTKGYFNDLMDKFFKLYPNYLKLEYIGNYKFFVSEHFDNVLLKNKSFIDEIFINENIKKQALSYFSDLLNNSLSFFNKKIIEIKKDKVFEFIYEPYTYSSFIPEIEKIFNDLYNKSKENELSNFNIKSTFNSNQSFNNPINNPNQSITQELFNHSSFINAPINEYLLEQQAINQSNQQKNTKSNHKHRKNYKSLNKKLNDKVNNKNYPTIKITSTSSTPTSHK